MGCGGSLIGAKYVMSACHCRQSSGVVAVMGTLEWQETRNAVSVHGNMECHPDWNSNKMDYDFSIMTLREEVDLTNPNYAVLQVAYTPLVDLHTCRQSWGVSRITDRMQCVGGNGVNSGCKGDSGGPLAVQDPEDGIWKLVGNTSWGPPACQTTEYGVWSSNAAVYDWINSTITA